MVGKQSPSSFSLSSSSSSFLSTFGGSLLRGKELQFGFRLSPFTGGAASPSFSSSEEEDDVSSPFTSALSDNLESEKEKTSYDSFQFLIKSKFIRNSHIDEIVYLSCSS